MTNPVISVENLGKRYRLGQLEPYKTLRDALVKAARAPFRSLSSTRRASGPSSGNPSSDNYIWALRNVSFEVEEGEAVGIIGRNGAGKTTLLKILSRITEPTEGRVEIRGRVGSLLEVGTGFHPELTGRENVYLNGAILGMRKAEVDRRFDEIVAFAELERFMETPVKRFSSGMYVRLAFAVAAHLEPEVLLVDEVLAVGDTAFQKKCLGKMNEVAGEGRTVLFVSHNLGAVRSLCRSSILLKDGSIASFGDTREVVDEYLLSAVSESEEDLESKECLGDTDRVRFTSIELLDEGGNRISSLKPGQPLLIELAFDALGLRTNYRIGISIASPDEVRLFTVHHEIVPDSRCNLKESFRIRASMENRLRPGTYYVEIGAHAVNGAWWCFVPKALRLTIEDIVVDRYNLGFFSAPTRWTCLSRRGN